MPLSRGWLISVILLLSNLYAKFERWTPLSVRLSNSVFMCNKMTWHHSDGGDGVTVTGLKEMDGKFWRNMVKGDSNESEWLGLETGTWCKWQRMKKVSDTLSTIVIPFIFSKIRLAGSSKQPRHIQGNTFFFLNSYSLPLWNNAVSSTDTNLQEKLVFWCSFENSYWSYRAVKEDNCQAQGI